ncbi:MAG: septum formation initiator family protein [Chloroflexi bacterium]|nr:septum formation initiator family protein [Chloroflexota bacterium]
MKRFRFNDRRILWIGALIILVLLMMDFNNRMSELLRLNTQHDQISTEVADLVSTQQSLEAQIAYATSDVAVQEWARQEAHLAQPGDIPIVPVAPPGSTPQPPVIAVPTAVPVNNWQVWQALFFGK